MNPTFHDRFGGIARLVSDDGLARLARAHVAVVGIGGVGSWAAEALARSGIGRLTLLDLDEVCISNVNRQLHATEGDIGRPKAVVMAERVRSINPSIDARPVLKFFTASTANDFLHTQDPPFDFVIDCIDTMTNKALLLANCRRSKIPVISCGAAGGLTDPTKIQVADLGKAYQDPLLSLVRRKLRRSHGYPKGEGKRLRIRCVFSPELPAYSTADGGICRERPEDAGERRLSCNQGFGTATFLTGTFGFVAAAHVVEKLSKTERRRRDSPVPSAAEAAPTA